MQPATQQTRQAGWQLQNAQKKQPATTRSFGSFAEAAEEAGMSRIYGGIHFGFDNVDGLASGRAVGRHVVARLFNPRDDD